MAQAVDSMAVQSMTLPYKVEAKIRAFLDARVDGSIVLDIKRGEIMIPS
jgi:hypothetical protein